MPNNSSVAKKKKRSTSCAGLKGRMVPLSRVNLQLNNGDPTYGPCGKDPYIDAEFMQRTKPTKPQSCVIIEPNTSHIYTPASPNKAQIKWESLQFRLIWSLFGGQGSVGFFGSPPDTPF